MFTLPVPTISVSRIQNIPRNNDAGLLDLSVEIVLAAVLSESCSTEWFPTACGKRNERISNKWNKLRLRRKIPSECVPVLRRICCTNLNASAECESESIFPLWVTSLSLSARRWNDDFEADDDHMAAGNAHDSRRDSQSDSVPLSKTSPLPEKFRPLTVGNPVKWFYGPDTCRSWLNYYVAVLHKRAYFRCKPQRQCC